MSREGALWIGGLESYMDEDFIQKALHMMGEVNLLSIKVRILHWKCLGGIMYVFINHIFLGDKEQVYWRSCWLWVYKFYQRPSSTDMYAQVEWENHA